MASSTPSLAMTSPVPRSELSRLPGASKGFDPSQVWARGTSQQQLVSRNNVTRAPWVSEFTGTFNQAIPGSSAQQPGQQNSEGMYFYCLL